MPNVACYNFDSVESRLSMKRRTGGLKRGTRSVREYSRAMGIQCLPAEKLNWSLCQYRSRLSSLSPAPYTSMFYLFKSPWIRKAFFPPKVPSSYAVTRNRTTDWQPCAINPSINYITTTTFLWFISESRFSLSTWHVVVPLLYQLKNIFDIMIEIKIKSVLMCGSILLH